MNMHYQTALKLKKAGYPQGDLPEAREGMSESVHYPNAEELMDVLGTPIYIHGHGDEIWYAKRTLNQDVKELPVQKSMVLALAQMYLLENRKPTWRRS